MDLSAIRAFSIIFKNGAKDMSTIADQCDLLEKLMKQHKTMFMNRQASAPIKTALKSRADSDDTPVIAEKKKPLNWQSIWTGSKFGGKAKFPDQYKEIKERIGLINIMAKKNHFSILAELRTEIGQDGYENWARWVKLNFDDTPEGLPKERTPKPIKRETTPKTKVAKAPVKEESDSDSGSESD